MVKLKASWPKLFDLLASDSNHLPISQAYFVGKKIEIDEGVWNVLHFDVVNHDNGAFWINLLEIKRRSPPYPSPAGDKS